MRFRVLRPAWHALVIAALLLSVGQAALRAKRRRRRSWVSQPAAAAAIEPQSAPTRVATVGGNNAGQQAGSFRAPHAGGYIGQIGGVVGQAGSFPRQQAGGFPGQAAGSFVAGAGGSVGGYGSVPALRKLDIDRLSFHNLSRKSYPLTVCRSKNMCDIKLLSKTPLHKHHGAEVFAAEAVPSSGIARLAAKELHTNKIDIRLMDKSTPISWGRFFRGFSNSQHLCCHDYITEFFATFVMNIGGKTCGIDGANDHETCSSPANVIEGWGPHRGSFKDAIPSPGAVYKIFGVSASGDANPDSSQQRARAVKLILTQLLMAMKHFERRGTVSRHLSWSHIFYTEVESPPRLRLSMFVVDTVALWKTVRESLLRDSAPADVDEGPFTLPVRSTDQSFVQGHMPAPPELNERIVSPYMLSRAKADMIVEKRAALSKPGASKKMTKAFEEAFDKPPRTFHAPDMWNLGVMLLQLLQGTFKGTPQLKMLFNMEKFFGCAQQQVPPFSRDYDDEKKSSKKYLPTIDFLLHQTFSFSAGPPTIGWKGLEQDAAMKPYVPMLKRLLDCDYKSRARINEAVLLTQQLPGGETFPQDTR